MIHADRLRQRLATQVTKCRSGIHRFQISPGAQYTVFGLRGLWTEAVALDVPLGRCPAFEGIGQVFQFIDQCANEMNGPLSKSYSPANRREGVPRSPAPRMGRCSGQLVGGGWVITLESRRRPFACLLASFRDIYAKQKLSRLRTWKGVTARK